MNANIINGPSKLDLIASLLFCCNLKSQRHPVTFTVKQGDAEPIRKFDVVVNITSMQIEDGSGESWNLEGLLNNGERISFYYRTDSRKGHIDKM